MDERVRYVILEMVKKCTDLGLGNFSFCYFPTPDETEEKCFQLNQLADYWELVVSQGQKRDMYRICGRDIKYRYSEED